MTSPLSVSGSCHCGAVQFEVQLLHSEVVNCHCKTCQKLSGSAFIAYMIGDPQHYRLTTGAEALRHYPSSPQVQRPFCGTCSSSLPIVDARVQQVFIPASLIDRGLEDLSPHVSVHMFMAENPPWHQVGDGGQQFPGFPRA